MPMRPFPSGYENKKNADKQTVNCRRFGERETEQQHRADLADRFRLARGRLDRLARRNAHTDTGAQTGNRRNTCTQKRHIRRKKIRNHRN